MIGGSPGSGKSTLARMLYERRGCPWIDYGHLRQFHLLPDWSNQSKEEEQLTFENLTFIVRNYWRYGYPEVLLDDLRDHRIVQLPSCFPEARVDTITLFLSDPDALRMRIAMRNDGWKYEELAIEWNRAVQLRPPVRGEVKLDVTSLTPEEVLLRANEVLSWRS